jgi:hypothetical protein
MRASCTAILPSHGPTPARTRAAGRPPAPPPAACPARRPARPHAVRRHAAVAAAAAEAKHLCLPRWGSVGSGQAASLISRLERLLFYSTLCRCRCAQAAPPGARSRRRTPHAARPGPLPLGPVASAPAGAPRPWVGRSSSGSCLLGGRVGAGAMLAQVGRAPSLCGPAVWRAVGGVCGSCAVRLVWVMCDQSEIHYPASIKSSSLPCIKPDRERGSTAARRYQDVDPVHPAHSGLRWPKCCTRTCGRHVRPPGETARAAGPASQPMALSGTWRSAGVAHEGRA